VMVSGVAEIQFQWNKMSAHSHGPFKNRFI
jgi:hypothetical protein